jgi:hypothetical protein
MSNRRSRSKSHRVGSRKAKRAQRRSLSARWRELKLPSKISSILMPVVAVAALQALVPLNQSNLKVTQMLLDRIPRGAQDEGDSVLYAFTVGTELRNRSFVPGHVDRCEITARGLAPSPRVVSIFVEKTAIPPLHKKIIDCQFIFKYPRIVTQMPEWELVLYNESGISIVDYIFWIPHTPAQVFQSTPTVPIDGSPVPLENRH